MGVHDLWKLLAPCGHRVSIDTLASSRLAVDAMRDESGAITPHAHIIGLMRRLLRLLFHGIRPVFVFDGAAPKLKRQTIAQRRQKREQYGDSIKRMAEKILLGQLKMRSVQQLRKKLAERAAAAKAIKDGGEAAGGGEDTDAAEARPSKRRRKSTKASTGASAASSSAATAAASSGADAQSAIDVDDEEEEQEKDEAMRGASEPAADDRKEREEDQLRQQQQPQSSRKPRSHASSSRATAASSGNDEEDAAPDFIVPSNASGSEGEGDDDDGDPHSARARRRRERADEAFILPADGVVDAAVLAQLPISLQYTVMQQQREHARFHNMHKFTALEHDPDAFSNLQMQGFLKSVKFSQSIDTIRKEMNLSIVPGNMRSGGGGGSGGQGDDRTTTAKDGRKVVVQGSLRIPSNPSSGGFVFYKTTSPAAPFSWQEAMRTKKTADNRAANREAKWAREHPDGAAPGGGGGGARKREDQRAGMETEQEESERLSREEAAEQAWIIEAKLAAASAAEEGGKDQDWLCDQCAAVNTGLRRMDSEAAKNKCQTCGAKREGAPSDDASTSSSSVLTHPLQRGAPSSSFSSASAGVGVGVLPRSSTLLPSFPIARSSMPEKPRAASTWISPADRTAEGKQRTPPRPPAAVVAPSRSNPVRPAAAMHDDAEDVDEMPALETAAARSVSRPPPPPPAATLPLMASVHAALDGRDAVSACAHCTFVNPLHARFCGMCESPLTRENVALISGPSTLAASFQDKAARRVAAANREIMMSRGTAASAPTTVSNRHDPVDFSVDARTVITASSPPRPVPLPSSSSAADALDITIDTSSSAQSHVVDDLFASMLAAKSITAVHLPPVVVTAAPSSTTNSAATSASTPAAAAVVAAAAKPLHADFLEISDDDDEDEAKKLAAQKVEANAEAKARAETRRKLELQEAAQLRQATRASLRDQAAVSMVAAAKKPAGGLSMHAAPIAAQPGAIINLADAPSSAAHAEVIDDDILWEDDENAEQAAAAAVATAALAQPSAAAPSSASVEEEEATAMDMDDSDDDKPSAAAKVKAEPVAESEQGALRRSSSAPRKSPVEAAKDAKRVSEPTPASAASVAPVAASIPSSVTARVISPGPVLAAPSSTAAAPAAVISPPAASVLPPAVASSPVLPPDQNDEAEEEGEEDLDDETARDRAELKQLLAEIEVLEGSIQQDEEQQKEEEEEESGGGGLEAEDVSERPAAAAAAPATAALPTVTEVSEDEEKEKEDAPMPSPSASVATPAVAPAVAAPIIPAALSSTSVTSTPASDIVLPFGLTMTSSAPPTARAAASNAFLDQQRKKRAREEQEERERQAQIDQREQAVLGQPAPAAPAAAAAASASSSSSSDAAPMAWEAFPSNLSTEDSLQLASSFDSSYLESVDAAKKSADARRGEAHVTEEMISESQELLRMFGIPFVVAPGEAEAQCATLETLGLVHGVITDDSDVFLFGAKTVFRHFFESKKYCESYRMEEVSAKLGMDRQRLVHWAMLMGSDYTEGVRGVGIVNATEIMNAFPGPRGLEELRDWVYSDSADEEPSLPNYPAEDEFDTPEAFVAAREELDRTYRIAAFKYAHRNTKRGWALSPHFPNREVIDAYWHPNVDDSAAEFSWQSPDWEGIRSLCAGKLGWTPDQIEQQVGPVVKAMGAGPRQSALDRFFSPDDQFAAIASSRLSRAVQGLANPKHLTEQEKQHQQDNQARKEAANEARKAKQKEKSAEKKRLKAAAEAAVASGDPSAPGAGPSLLDDDFSLSAADEAMLVAAEAAATSASPAKLKQPKKKPAQPRERTPKKKAAGAAAAVSSPAAAASPTAEKQQPAKRKRKAATNAAAAQTASTANSSAAAAVAAARAVDSSASKPDVVEID